MDLVAAINELTELNSLPPTPTTRIARRVLFSYLLPDTDLMARLSLLEGVSGVTPGTWLRAGKRGFAQAKASFPGLSPAWWAPGSSGVLKAAIQQVAKAFKNAYIPGVTPESFVQDYLIGVSPVTGAKVKPLFWNVGAKFSDKERQELGEGKVLPKDSSRGIARFFWQRAMSEVQNSKGKKQVSPDLASGDVRKEMEQGDLSNPLFSALRDPDHAVADKIRELLKQIARKSPKKEAAEIFVAYLDLIKHSSRVPTSGGNVDPQGTVVELETVTGKPKTMISKALKDMKAYVVEEGKKNPALLRLIDSVVSTEDLGYGQRFAKRASSDLLAEWAAEEEVAMEELLADRTVDLGPVSITTTKFPEAPRGGHRFAKMHAKSEVRKALADAISTGEKLQKDLVKQSAQFFKTLAEIGDYMQTRYRDRNYSIAGNLAARAALETQKEFEALLENMKNWQESARFSEGST